MTEFLSVLPGGIVTGAVYALIAMGLVFTYKATRVPNFAYGGMAGIVAFFHYRLVSGWQISVNEDLLFIHLHVHHSVHLAFWAAVPVSLAFAGLLGLVIERFLIRPFARASMVTFMIVTLGIGGLLGALTQQWFGFNDLIVPNERAMFPRRAVFALGRVHMSYEQLGVIGIVLALTAAVYVFFRYTETGLAIRATATDPDVASLQGVSARQLSRVSWGAGGIVAGLAGIMLASISVSSRPELIQLLAIKGFAAAIVGGLISFPIAVGAGVAIGLGEELARHYLVVPHGGLLVGAPEVITLGAVIIVLALRPKWIFKGIRDDEDAGVVATAGLANSALARAIDPAEAVRMLRAAVGPLGRGRVWPVLRWAVPLGLLAFAVAFPILPMPGFWAFPANFTMIYILVALSFVVLVGWLGQVSVAQGAFLGIGGAGAYIAAHYLHLPFPLPIVFAVVMSVPVSVLIGLPALRLRGLHFAIATFAFGLAAERTITPRFTVGGVRMPVPSYLTSDGTKYYVFLVCTALAFALAWRISTTQVGRSFRAIRDSETVATAYGIRTVRVKLTGFVVSGAIAALAGALLAYQLGNVVAAYVSVSFSIVWLGNAIVGGILALGGPVVGALLFGLLPELQKSQVKANNIDAIPAIRSAALLLIVMMVRPAGLASFSEFFRRRTSAYAADDSDDLAAIEAAAATVDVTDAADRVGVPAR